MAFTDFSSSKSTIFQNCRAKMKWQLKNKIPEITHPFNISSTKNWSSTHNLIAFSKRKSHIKCGRKWLTWSVSLTLSDVIFHTRSHSCGIIQTALHTYPLANVTCKGAPATPRCLDTLSTDLELRAADGALVRLSLEEDSTLSPHAVQWKQSLVKTLQRTWRIPFLIIK